MFSFLRILTVCLVFIAAIQLVHVKYKQDSLPLFKAQVVFFKEAPQEKILSPKEQAVLGEELEEGTKNFLDNESSEEEPS